MNKIKNLRPITKGLLGSDRVVTLVFRKKILMGVVNEVESVTLLLIHASQKWHKSKFLKRLLFKFRF
jgi:hypothetical protein